MRGLFSYLCIEMIVILVFGGNKKRLETALFRYKGLKAESNQSVKLVVSAMPKSFVEASVQSENIPLDDLICVYTGLDTLTELISTKKLINNNLGAKELYLTSDHWHLPRIRAIANVVYLFSGIKIREEPCFLDMNRSESKSMVLIDRFRAYLWRFTGKIILGKNVEDRREGIKNLEFQ